MVERRLAFMRSATEISIESVQQVAPAVPGAAADQVSSSQFRCCTATLAPPKQVAATDCAVLLVPLQGGQDIIGNTYPTDEIARLASLL